LIEYLPCDCQSLLIFVASGCFVSYKIDYSDEIAEPRFVRRSNLQVAFRGIR
jgi:hypothetical protein